MADLADIRAGFAAALLDAFPQAQCTGYLLDNPTTPCFEVSLAEENGIEFDLAMQRGADAYNFVVRALVATGLSLGAQRRLDEWFMSESQAVKDALEDAPTLPVNGAATVSDLHVTGSSGPRTFAVISVPNTPYLGAEWSVRVLA